MKSKKTKRKLKFVVWLHNFRDRDDDEWAVVWASTRSEAQKTELIFDSYRFYRGYTYTAKEFRERMGIKA